ncbi:TBPIP-domain-containing protein [Cyathus striatus]|nr:TBPIP-domain-containing protein [Cyathus striatus]
MATKAKQESKVAVLKGQEAEDKILEYIKRVQHEPPYGAVDIAANLKGAVPKAATQKILVSLAEKGELLQKTYACKIYIHTHRKTTFFVANQDKLEAMPAEKIAALEAEIKTLEEGNKALTTKVKAATADLAKLKVTPTDTDLDQQIAQAQTSIATAQNRLKPLRSGAPVASAEELLKLDAEWNKWRTEWVRRRKIFNTFWQLATDALTGNEASGLAEELGIEMDSPEHASLERGALCALKSSNPLKRKRI